MPTRPPAQSTEDAAGLLFRARTSARLAQRELAEHAHTSQSVIARIEGGRTNPSMQTLDRILAAAGFELRRTLSPKPVVHSHMLEDSARILRMSPAERLREVSNMSRFLANARRV
jgi:predicted transcriptional regulator